MSTNTTVVDAVVVDASGNAVTGLSAADFTLTVNGAPRGITAFAEMQFDAAPPSPAPDPSGAITTNRGFDRGRLVALVIDDSSPMSAVDALAVRPTAEAAVRSLDAGTLAAVVFTSGSAAAQNFTANRSTLLRAVATVRPRIASTTLGNASDTNASLDFDESSSAHYLAVTGALKRVAEALRAQPDRQKTILLISPGLPLDLSESGLSFGGDNEEGTPLSTEPQGVRAMMLDQTRDIIRAAAESRVTITGLDPGGLRATVAKPNREYLRGLSASTGGEAIVNTNNPANALTRLWRSTRTYYLIGFETPDKTPLNPKVALHVNRPGVVLRFRRTDVGKPSVAIPTESGLAGALHGLLPSTDIALDVNLTPIIHSRDVEASVAVVTAVSLPVAEAVLGQRDTVTMSVNAYDRGDRPVASRQVTGRIGLSATPGTLEFDMLCRLDLKPGDYRLRIAVSSSATGKAGSVFADLNVPGPASSPLLASPVMLAAPGRAASPADAFRDLLAFVPTHRRVFQTDAPITAAVALFQGRQRPADVKVSTRLIREDESEVFGHAETIAADQFSSERSTIYETLLPDTALTPGTYIVEITARGAGLPSISRTTRITIRSR